MYFSFFFIVNVIYCDVYLILNKREQIYKLDCMEYKKSFSYSILYFIFRYDNYRHCIKINEEIIIKL